MPMYFFESTGIVFRMCMQYSHITYILYSYAAMYILYIGIYDYICALYT